MEARDKGDKEHIKTRGGVRKTGEAGSLGKALIAQCKSGKD